MFLSISLSLFILQSLFSHIESKINDKLFLSKCVCTDFGKPDCDFDKLSKKNLKILVDKLVKYRIVCAKSEEYFLPTFTASLFSASASSASSSSSSSSSSASSSDVPSEKTKTKEHVCPAPKNETIPKPTIPDCKLDGLRCSTKQGIDYLFPTTLITHQIVYDTKTKQYNDELKQLMLRLEKENDGCTFNLHGGYRSKDGFLQRSEPAVKWLKSQIYPRVHYLLNLANATDIEFEIDGWGAVLRGGDGQNAHVHPGSMYAGVYYVSVPKEVSESGKSGGCLFFMDPRPAAGMSQVVRGKNLYGDPFELCPGPEGGLLVMFPPWLMHEVKPMPSEYEGPRIGISFNVIYKPLYHPAKN